MDGFCEPENHGKSHLEMDDDWSYPHDELETRAPLTHKAAASSHASTYSVSAWPNSSGATAGGYDSDGGFPFPWGYPQELAGFWKGKIPI